MAELSLHFGSLFLHPQFPLYNQAAVRSAASKRRGAIYFKESAAWKHAHGIWDFHVWASAES